MDSLRDGFRYHHVHGQNKLYYRGNKRVDWFEIDESRDIVTIQANGKIYAEPLNLAKNTLNYAVREGRYEFQLELPTVTDEEFLAMLGITE